jgi:gliding motility-associated lipoprotein GldH
MLKPILSLWAFVLLCGCGSEHLADYQTIPNGEWSEDQPIEFSLPKLDSTAQYDVLLSLRNSIDYPFNNLFLLVTLSHPDGYQQVDTLEYRMARPDGSWLGVGAGNLKDNLLEYRRAMTFDQAGHYRLSLAHALRRNGEVQGVSSLNGVMELGYQLIKIE